MLHQIPSLNASCRSVESKSAQALANGTLDPLSCLSSAQFTAESLAPYRNLLHQQEKAINALTETMLNNSKDLETIRYGYSLQ